MLKGVVKSVLLGVAVTVVAVALISGQVKKPPDPLADWVYPKAKRGLDGTDQPPLIWAKFTATDAFEKVWDFYWHKSARGIPQPKPNVRSGTIHYGAPTSPEHIICAYFRDHNPKAKFGVFAIREKQRTVSVTIFQRSGEKETTIILVLDQR